MCDRARKVFSHGPFAACSRFDSCSVTRQLADIAIGRLKKMIVREIYCAVAGAVVCCVLSCCCSCCCFLAAFCFL